GGQSARFASTEPSAGRSPRTTRSADENSARRAWTPLNSLEDWPARPLPMIGWSLKYVAAGPLPIFLATWRLEIHGRSSFVGCWSTLHADRRLGSREPCFSTVAKIQVGSN